MIELTKKQMNDLQSTLNAQPLCACEQKQLSEIQHASDFAKIAYTWRKNAGHKSSLLIRSNNKFYLCSEGASFYF